LHAKDSDIVMSNFAAPGSGRDYIVDVKFKLVEFLKLIFTSKKLIHAQFTNFYLLMMLYFCGWRHDIVLTLHNRRLVLLSGWKRWIVNRLLQHVKYVIYNDPTYTPLLQEKFDIDDSKIVILPTYISPGKDELKGLTPDITSFLSQHEYTVSANAHRVIQNVFGDLYGIDQLISLMDKLVNEKGMDVGLVFCISEIFNHEYYNECCAKIKELGLERNFHFVIQSPVNGFEVWAATDLFLRPTMSDMEGVSVKEALQFGTPVVASDVCIRPKEEVLYRTGDAEDLFEQVYPLLQRKTRVTYNPEVQVEDEILRIYSLLS
jgi:glycosyltransferase involved in cell wall biosynthesis